MKDRADNPRQAGETGPVQDQGPASWVETLAGVALFLAFGAFLFLEEILSGWEAPGSIQLRNALFWMLLLLPPSGVAIGWVRNFPRWSYPYAGLAVLAGMYMANASSPGVSLFGIPVFGRELWGWRALVPLLLACGTSLLVTRSFRPLYVLFDRAARDLTLVTYGMFGGLPLWVFVSFDEMDRRYSLSWMVGFPCSPQRVGVHLRTVSRAVRCNALLGSSGTTHERSRPALYAAIGADRSPSDA